MWALATGREKRARRVGGSKDSAREGPVVAKRATWRAAPAALGLLAGFLAAALALAGTGGGAPLADPAGPPVVAMAATPPEMDADAILDAIVDNMRGGGMQAVLSLSVSRPQGETRYEVEILSDGEERAFLRVTQPPREAGQAFLRDGNNLWLYVPRLERVLRLPPSGKSDRFLGSDISYSDLSGRDAQHDYEARIAGQTGEDVTLELLPRAGAPTPYGRVTLRAELARLAPLEMIFFDQRGQAARKVTFEAYVEAGGHWVPTRVAVEDLLRPGQRTTMEYRRYRFGVGISPACFTLQALESGCPDPISPAGGKSQP